VIYIDNCAYNNLLKDHHPIEKMLFALLTMVVCLASTTIIVPIVVLILMTYMIIKRAGIPAKFYFHLMLVPFSFLVLGLISIVLGIIKDPAEAIISLNVFNYDIGITKQGLSQAKLLFFRSFGTISCLYFLALTTPIVDIASVLRKMKLPEIYIELMILIYRVIFILISIIGRTYNAQAARLGFSSIKNQYRSLAYLVSSLFVHAYSKTNNLFVALESRCYTGTLNVLEKEYVLNKKHLIYIILLDLSLLLMGILAQLLL
jgi:cobalt/nickel transport system permease protein